MNLRTLAGLGCSLVLLLPTVASAADGPPQNPRKLTIADYFVRLPAGTLEAPAKDWLPLARVDTANGYLSCEADGAQPRFVVVLFRFSDGRPLLALGEAELEGKPNLLYIRFFEEAADGSMRSARHLALPKRDGKPAFENGDQRYYFELPRRGRTILVRDAKSNSVRQKLTWTGEKFEASE